MIVEPMLSLLGMTWIVCLGWLALVAVIVWVVGRIDG